MGRIDDYARALEQLADPEPYLLEHSGLPGSRGNIELGLAAAQVCEPALLRRWASLDARAAPTGGAEEFLAFCWVVLAGCSSRGTRTRWAGRQAFEALVERAAQSDDRELRWIARENQRKRRLERLDSGWVTALRSRLG
jgi:hypothetical protein